MPIRFKKNASGLLTFEQNPIHPYIYLDNWTWDDLITYKVYRERFIKLINEKNGTIAISETNIKEIAKRDDTNQISKIAAYIDCLNTVYIGDNAIRVVEKENI